MHSLRFGLLTLASFLMLQSPAFCQQLSVVSADWGAGTTKIDVTERLRQKVVNETLRLDASTSILGDPTYGKVKTLTVSYRSSRGTFKVSLREGKRLELNAHSTDAGEIGAAAGIPATADARSPRVAPPQFAERKPPPKVEVSPPSAEVMRIAEELRKTPISVYAKGEQGFLATKIVIPVTNGRATIPPGSRIGIVAKDGSLWTAHYRGIDFQIEPSRFTTDPVVAAKALCEVRAEEHAQLAASIKLQESRVPQTATSDPGVIAMEREWADREKELSANYQRYRDALELARRLGLKKPNIADYGPIWESRKAPSYYRTQQE